MFRPALFLRSVFRCAPLALLALVAHAQTQPSFQTKVTPTSLSQQFRAYSVDVNNDGLPDIIQDFGQAPNQPYQFRVRLANGDGTFREGYRYAFPSQYQGPFPMAFGDLNGDGKADLIFEAGGTQQLVVFLGNGDGTFQTPRYETVALPSGEHFGIDSFALADFNRDGKLDLVTEANTDYTGQIVVMPGNGDGTFSAGRVIYTPPSGQGPGSVAIGDFDSDGKADIAFANASNCAPDVCGGPLHVEYGNGDFTFTDTTPFTSTGVFYFSTGDLNGDGRTDIFGTDFPKSNRVITLYSTGTRGGFTLYTSVNPFSPYTNLALADFNGDKRMDIVGVSSFGSTPELNVLAATADPGVFTKYSYPLAGGPATNYRVTDPVVGDFNGDTKPDVYISSGDPTQKSSFAFVSINSTTSGNWGGCRYPKAGEGVAVCLPKSSAASPVIFRASASSFGELRKIELWVDGKKIAEQHHVWEQYGWFNFSTTSYSGGSHNATFYAADVDNRLLQVKFSFTVSSGSCTAPSSPGVNVCSPVSGSITSSPVAVSSKATILGTLARMEVWVDGMKKYTETTSTTLSTSIALNAGYHRFDIYAVNTAGSKWQKTVYSTVR